MMISLPFIAAAARVVAASKIIADFRQCKRWLDEQEQRMKEKQT